MTANTSSLLLLMSFAAGTFAAGSSNNPQHLMLSQPSGGIPNNLLPLIIWPNIAPDYDEELQSDSAAWFESTFHQNGWPTAWRAPIFPYTHYHPNTHEVLGIASGWVEVMFGGDTGRMVTLREGDAVLIPAGVGHRQISASEDFFAIGAYPEGLSPETVRDEPSRLQASKVQIAHLPVPHRDPFTGGEGAMTDIWLPIANQLMHQ